MFYYSTVDDIVTTHGPIEEKDGIEMANNNSQIPAHEMKKITRYILLNRARIIAAWYSYFSL